MDFVRKQGVVGVAVGLVIATAVTKMVNAFINDLISPILALILGQGAALREWSVSVGTVKFMLGDFIMTLIDFLVICAIIYVAVTHLKLDKLDKKKD